MAVEEIRRSSSQDESKKDQFPIGMRVLAVDDDKTCLRVLETFLRRCQYHVTTATQAETALTMLRKNKNKFDLVISDVQMPDMDGFKLLELVGLEMDLPVIMLSGNSDPRLVMKGVTHGACDYLLKPVRIEELKNIWQHVIRRKKSDSKDQTKSDDPEKSQQGVVEEGHSPSAAGNSERNGKQNRKRKEQIEDEDEEDEENGNETEDSTTQKKPRVVWSQELHQKFVLAVNQLGIDKAVPKKILDLMNVDRLTRENVASHLQKYRLYLKRLSDVASQQANMVAALSGKDPSYLRMGSLDRLGDFHNFSGHGQLPNLSVASLSPGGMLGKLNTPTGLGLRGLASSGMIQLGHGQNSSNSLNDFGKLQQQQVVAPGNQLGNLLQGMPTTLELDQLQQIKGIPRVGEFSTANLTPFQVSNGFLNTNNSFGNVRNNPLMLQGPRQQNQNRMAFGNQPPGRLPSLSSESFEIVSGVSSHLPDLGRCSDNWQNSNPLTGYPSNSLPSSDAFSRANLASSNTTIAPYVGSSSINASLQNMASSSMLDLRSDAGPVNLRHDNSVSKNVNYASKQTWEDHKQDYTQDSNLIFSSLNSSMPIQGVVGPLGRNLGHSNSVGSGNLDTIMTPQSNSGTPYLIQHNGGERTNMEATVKLNDDHFFDQTKSQDGISSSCGSLEDMMSVFRREQDGLTLIDGDISCDFPLGTCMPNFAS